MPISPDLLKILVCPEIKTPLQLASASVLNSINEKIMAKTVKNKGGTLITEPLTEGLLRQDGKVLYPIREGIPLMLIEEGISL